MLDAAGFAPMETVTFRFGLVDPFSGTTTNPVLTAVGVTDRFGRLGATWGKVPVPLQSLPASTQASIYSLAAAGATSGRVSIITVCLPFVALSTGLRCPERPPSPSCYGYAISDPSTGFTAGTEVAGAVDFPAPVEGAARVNMNQRTLNCAADESQ